MQKTRPGLKKTKEKENLPREPIAIVGIGCRFPGGANDPRKFWELLVSGTDAITEIPGDRWNIDKFTDPDPGIPGRTPVRRGGFVDGTSAFDPEFFGISPREAESMDPQQRLLLETAWEALEDGGTTLNPKEGGDGGVFVGISTNDYCLAQSGLSLGNAVDMYTATGGAMSIAANRISFCLNLRGPSLSVDTACSSSLVSVHLACRSLWNGECEFALAGGVNFVLNPSTWLIFSRMSILSPEGRCKPFDADADGFVRGEGAGMLVLKPLSKARKDKDRIYALIRGTAVNQDGGESPAMVMPAQKSQEAVIQSACKSAGILPEQLTYVEAHGTGTPIGDPIEARSIGTIIGRRRPKDSPLCVGSVKSNIGHLESGAGVAGIIKAALTMYHRTIPPSLHFNSPNPDIDFESLNLRIPTAVESCKNGTTSLFAGVNSFGFGGTNAHIVLESIGVTSPQSNGAGQSQVLPENYETTSSECARIFPFSARSEDSLQAIAGEFRKFMGENPEISEISWNDIAHTRAVRRFHHPDVRGALVAQNLQEVLECLDAVSKGEMHPSWCEDELHKSCEDDRVVFVFCGQGTQWYAMGRQLIAEDPVFRNKIEECDALIRELGDWSLLEELGKDENVSRIHDTSIGQPAIFAIQVALAERWRQWGIEPAAVVGHSVGEVAAAHVAGILTLEDAVRVIFHRGRCMAEVEEGAMLAAGLSQDETLKLLAGYNGNVCLAATNSPSSVTISGQTDTLNAIGRELDERGVFQKRLRVRYAFHSAQMDPIRDGLLGSLNGLASARMTLPFYSTVTGKTVNGNELDAEYWWQNVRQPVQFCQAIESMMEAGFQNFLELGPHPALSAAISDTLRASGNTGRVIASLRRNENERAFLLKALGNLYAAGQSILWETVCPGKLVSLPGYVWNRKEYWVESTEHRHYRLGPRPHPFLGENVGGAEPTWEVRIGGRAQRMINDHSLQGKTVFPAAGYIEMALEAAKQTLGDIPCDIEQIEFLKPFFLRSRTDQSRMRFMFDPQQKTFRCYGGLTTGTDWTLLCRGEIYEIPHALLKEQHCDLVQEDGPVLAGSTELDVETIYWLFEIRGLNYGSCFRGIKKLWRKEREALGRIELPKQAALPMDSFRLNPALLDACLQVIIAAIPEAAAKEPANIYLPVMIERVRFYMDAPSEVWSHVKLLQHTKDFGRANILIFSPGGEIVASIEGLIYKVAGSAARDPQRDWLYRWSLEFCPLPDGEVVRRPVDFIPSADELIHRVRTKTNRDSSREPWLESYEKMQPEINCLCAVYIQSALLQLGWVPVRGEKVYCDQLADLLGIIPGYRGLLERYLRILEEDGFLFQTEGGGEGEWLVTRSFEERDVEVLWRSIMDRYSFYQIELSIIRRFGRELSSLLTGARESLQLLFAHDGRPIENLYAHGLVLRRCNQMVGETVLTILDGLPKGRRVRILEVGAGTGGLTAGLLSFLSTESVSYTFSDISPGFLEKAENRFWKYPFIEYKLLDIEKDPIEQDFLADSYDLILCANVLHATADLKETLTNIRQLMAPGGRMVLLELVSPPRSVDITIALMDGWWKMRDQRAGSLTPLINTNTWEQLLLETGFDSTSSLESEDGSHALILAREPKLEKNHSKCIYKTPDFDLKGKNAAWLVFADAGGLASRLTGHLKEGGFRVIMIYAAEDCLDLGPDEYQVVPGDEEALRSVFENLPLVCGVIHLWSLDLGEPVENAEEISSCEKNLTSVVNLVQQLTQTENRAPSTIWFVTRGAQVDNEGGEVALNQSPLIGFLRTVSNEHPILRCRLIDLDPNGSMEEETAMVLAELSANSDEEEVLLRGEGRYGRRLKRTSLSRTTREMVAAEDVSFGLEVGRTGAIDSLVFRPRARRSPSLGEVEVEITCGSLNFRDVMKALGIYPTEGGESELLGDEFSGRITAVGEGVVDLAVGDEVFGVARGCLGSHLTTRSETVFQKPPELSFAAAVTIPITFLTASYGLEHLAGIQKGERVLIHAATGGVGLAAIQIARNAGAEIFATAGSPEKREFLKGIGIEHVMDSRSLAFSDEIRDITEGEGIDIVLNSLSGEAIPRSLGLLRDYGRFLEIGKVDIYLNTRIGLRAFRKNISYFSIDLSRTMEDRIPLIGALFEKLIQRFKRGILTPLPHTVLPHVQVEEAFRTMREARHIGKLVLTFGQGIMPMEITPEPDELPIVSNASYMITGGLSGFGLESARWLMDNGARSLALLSRSGAKTAEAQRAVEEFSQKGIQVLVIKADVSSRAELAAAMSEIEKKSLHPLRGIIHAAMVLDDGLVIDQNEERLHRVIAPKAHGGWNLHQLTKDIDLDFFIFYSSISSVVGNPGQSNYAAANMFMEALAQNRRLEGKNSLAINFGPISETGFVARNDEIADKLDKIGFRAMPPRVALKLTEGLLRFGHTQTAIVDLDLKKLLTIFTYIGNSSRYAAIISELESDDDDSERSRIRESLLAAPEGKRMDLILEYLKNLMARVLRTSPSKLDVNRPLTELGFDSLMAVELINRAESDLEIGIPIGQLSGQTISDLAEHLLSLALGGPAIPIRKGKQSASNLVEKDDGKLEEDQKSAEVIDAEAKPKEESDKDSDGLIDEPIQESLEREAPVVQNQD